MVQYPNENIHLFFNDKCEKYIYASETNDSSNTIKNGDLIYLHGECGVKKSVYQIVGYDDDTNSFVLRIVDVLPSVIYPITKQICEKMKIPYEKNLVMLPANIGWKKYIYEIEYDDELSTDLGEYPSYEGKIKHLFIRLSGCESVNIDTIKMPNGKCYSKHEIAQSLQVIAKGQLGMYNSNTIGTHITRNLMTHLWGDFGNYNGQLTIINRICDIKGDIYLELVLNTFNLSESDLKGKTFEDLFLITYPNPQEERKVVTPTPQPTTKKKQPSNIPNITLVRAIDGIMRSLDDIHFEVYKDGKWVSTTVRNPDTLQRINLEDFIRETSRRFRQ